MPTRRRSIRVRSAYTLIEVMAVLAIAALAFAAFAPGLAGASDRARFDRFVAELIDLDARARLLSQRSGGCLIEHDPAAGTLRLRAVEGPQETITQLTVPPDIELEWNSGLRPPRFDRLGRSADYAVRVIGPAGNIELGFNGHTGWHIIDRERTDG